MKYHWYCCGDPRVSVYQITIWIEEPMVMMMEIIRTTLPLQQPQRLLLSRRSILRLQLMIYVYILMFHTWYWLLHMLDRDSCNIVCNNNRLMQHVKLKVMRANALKNWLNLSWPLSHSSVTPDNCHNYMVQSHLKESTLHTRQHRLQQP